MVQHFQKLIQTHRSKGIVDTLYLPVHFVVLIQTLQWTGAELTSFVVPNLPFQIKYEVT